MLFLALCFGLFLSPVRSQCYKFDGSLDNSSACEGCGEPFYPDMNGACYEIVSNYNGQAMDIGDIRDGNRVLMWNRNGNAAQQFEFSKKNDGSYVIRTCRSAGTGVNLWFDLDNVSTRKLRVVGAENNQANQKFYPHENIIKVDPYNGYCLDLVYPGRQEVFSYPYCNWINQKWRYEPVHQPVVQTSNRIMSTGEFSPSLHIFPRLRNMLHQNWKGEFTIRIKLYNQCVADRLYTDLKVSYNSGEWNGGHTTERVNFYMNVFEEAVRNLEKNERRWCDLNDPYSDEQWEQILWSFPDKVKVQMYKWRNAATGQVGDAAGFLEVEMSVDSFRESKCPMGLVLGSDILTWVIPDRPILGAIAAGIGYIC